LIFNRFVILINRKWKFETGVKLLSTVNYVNVVNTFLLTNYIFRLKRIFTTDILKIYTFEKKENEYG